MCSSTTPHHHCLYFPHCYFCTTTTKKETAKKKCSRKFLSISYFVTGLTNVLNHTSNKVESPSIVSQETCASVNNSCNHNSIRQQTSQKQKQNFFCIFIKHILCKNI